MFTLFGFNNKQFGIRDPGNDRTPPGPSRQPVRKIALPGSYGKPKADTGAERFCVVIENAFSSEWCRKVRA